MSVLPSYYLGKVDDVRPETFSRNVEYGEMIKKSQDLLIRNK